MGLVKDIINEKEEKSGEIKEMSLNGRIHIKFQ